MTGVQQWKDIGAWAFVIVMTAVGSWFGIRDARQDQADRRSSIGGRQIRYGAGSRYRPRSALWTGLLMIWLAMSTATMLVVLLAVPAGGSVRPYLAVVCGGLTVGFLVIGVRSLRDYARTDVVEGTVLERKIVYSGE
jgi:hypothetical protein